MADKLTEKQKRFCDEYLIDLNATQAAIRAGYSDKTANRIANENLSKLDIQEYIQKRMKDREKRTEITQDKVLNELAKIGFVDIKQYLQYKTAKTVIDHDAETGEPIIDYKQIIDVLDSSEVDGSVIQEVSIGKDGTFKFKLHDKMSALEKIGKHLGMFTDKVESKNINENLNTDMTNLSADDRKKRINELIGKMQDK